MKKEVLRVLGVLVLVGIASMVLAQSGDDATITQLRGTVEKLSGLVEDQNIPPETREQLNELLFEKRGELHALLRQQRDALRARLRGNPTAKESVAITNRIRQTEALMKQLMQNSGSVANVEDAHRQSAQVVVSEVPEAPIVVPSETPATATTAPAETATLSATPTAPTIVTPSPLGVTNTAAGPISAVSAAQDPACADFPAGPVSADENYRRQVRAATCRMLDAKAGTGNLIDKELGFLNYTDLIALTIARANLPNIQRIVIPELTAQAENASHAKDLSSGDAGAGSTSLVSKAGVPAIFGFATEHGGLTKNTDGTTITFTGNPVGLVQAMAKKGFIDAFQEQDEFTKFLRKLSFGISFDTSRGTEPATFTGSKQQLSGFTFKFNAVDQRDPRQRKYTDKWKELTKNQAAELARTYIFFVKGLYVPAGQTSPPALAAFNAWLKSANTALSGKTTTADIEATLVDQLKKLQDVELPPEQVALAVQAATAFDAFLEQRNKILDEISNGWIATFDYTNTRPVGTPSLSNFRFLAEKGAYNGSIDFTGNASVTIYNSQPTGPSAKRLRDFRFAGQLDVPIGDVTKTGKFLISLAGRYQRLLEDEPILGSTLVVPKGDIAAFQAKLTIPIRGTAFKIPLSLSFANRTELLKEREVRGNFGFTFDLDSIFAKFNPFSKP